LDDEINRILDRAITDSMARRGRTTIDSLLAPVRDTLARRAFPDESLSDTQIEMMLQILSSMDSDKDPEAARVGEREARVASPLVGKLSAGFNHGIGRSGQLSAPQPKAVGASVMQQVADAVAHDALRKLGLPNTRGTVVVPMSTGMTIGLVLAALRRELGVRKVIYPRLDHRSPSRGIALAGLEEVTAKTVLDGDAVCADPDDITKHLRDDKDSMLLATTTFFPPRAPDPVKDIARLAADHGVPLVINNAYGVQSAKVMSTIRSAIDAGRVDAVIQSGDKNFLCPVGSSILTTPNPAVAAWASETYAGRASAAPVVQTLAALLSLGLQRYEQLRNEQVEHRTLLEGRLREIAGEVGQRVLEVDNPVSVGFTLDGLDANEIGARLYNARVTGPRTVEKHGYGSCIDSYPHAYIVLNSAIGSSRNDVEKATTKFYKEVRG
jgi:O-phospho-L-seryl-tRNASec:L-selenocysteinyl-tRNA synthase